MKSLLQFIFVLLALVAGFFLFHYEMPHYTGVYAMMVVLLFADLYLWSALRKKIFSYRFWHKYVITFLFWLPLMMSLFLVIAAAVKPLIEWNDVFRTYWIGAILVFYASKLLPVLFLVIADLVRLIQKIPDFTRKEKRRAILEPREGISRSKFLQYLGYLSGGLVFSGMLAGMFKWVYDFNVVKKRLYFSRLPKAFDGFKMVQISDLHLGTWTSEKPLEEAIRIINNLNPDVVLFTGDLVNYATREAFRFEESLKKIKAPLGVFAILGNHDYGNYVNWPSKEAKRKNMEDLFSFYDRLGWKLLNNRHVKFENNGEQIALVGVENWGAHPRFPKRGDLKKATRGLENGIFNILMSHDPSHWDKVVLADDFPVDLTLSGHTHGFQFGIETKDFKWSPAQYMYKEWAGLYTDSASGKQIYVNRGLGSIGYPGRIGILPEITFIELRS